MHDFAINPTAQSCYINNSEEIQPQNIQELKAENTIQIVEQTEPEDSNAVNNKVLTQELSLENFKESLEKEFGCSFNDIDIDYNKDLLAKRFGLVLANLSDEEKAAKFEFVLNEFKSTPVLIKVFFESFKDKEKAKACADSVDYNTFKELDSVAQRAILMHMSVPGTNKLFNEYQAEVYTYYNQHQELIDRVYKNNLSDEERQELIKTLSDDEKNIINHYNELVQIGVNITQGVTENDNFSPEDTEEFVIQVNNFFKGLPSYNLFLEGMAKFLSDDNNNLDIDKKNLAELLEKISDNKFSEITQKIAEKSAIDNNTGLLKTVDAEKIAQSEEKIQEIKQELTEIQIPLSEINESDEVVVVAEAIDYEALTGSGSIEVIKDVFAGKIKVSDYLENAAIKQYKLMDTAMQGNILFDASGKFFNNLVANTKFSTLENLLSIGWKGSSFSATKKIKDEVEERKDDVA